MKTINFYLRIIKFRIIRIFELLELAKFSFIFFLNNKNKKVNIIFDYKTLGATYGDLFSCLILIRYLLKKKFSVNVYIIKDSFRREWYKLDADQKKELLKFHNQLLQDFTYQEKINVKTISFKDMFSIDLLLSFHRTLFLIHVLLRFNICVSCLNFLNKVLIKEKIDFIDSILLSAKDFDNFIPKGFASSFNSNYVTLNIRFSPSWQTYRNTDDRIIEQSIKFIKNKYQNKNIVILTDRAGYEKYKYKLKGIDRVYFSRDFGSNSFLNDASILIHSDFYYQKLGGGLGIIAIFSRTPYRYESILNFEKIYKKNKIFSWQTNEQNFILLGYDKGIYNL